MDHGDDDFDLLEYARAALAVQDFNTALVAASKAVEIARMGDGRGLDVANALQLKARSLKGLGRDDEAYATWEAAKIDYAALGSSDGVAECDANLNR